MREFPANFFVANSLREIDWEIRTFFAKQSSSYGTKVMTVWKLLWKIFNRCGAQRSILFVSKRARTQFLNPPIVLSEIFSMLIEKKIQYIVPKLYKTFYYFENIVVLLNHLHIFLLSLELHCDLHAGTAFCRPNVHGLIFRKPINIRNICESCLDQIFPNLLLSLFSRILDHSLSPKTHPQSDKSF